jgi:hypothetical protein
MDCGVGEPGIAGMGSRAEHARAVRTTSRQAGQLAEVLEFMGLTTSDRLNHG